MFSFAKLVKTVSVSSLIFATTIPLVTSLFRSQAVAQTPQEQPINREQVDRRSNLSFQPAGCQRKDTRVTCNVLVTNLNNVHRAIRFGARHENYQTRVIDFNGNPYIANSVQLNQYQGANERISLELAPGIPTKLAFNFRIPKQVTELTAIDLGYETIGRVDTITRTAVTNIGSITVPTKTANTPK